jgi:hypothetical protein
MSVDASGADESYSGESSVVSEEGWVNLTMGDPSLLLPDSSSRRAGCLEDSSLLPGRSNHGRR